jgi:hypothetical protein
MRRVELPIAGGPLIGIDLELYHNGEDVDVHRPQNPFPRSCSRIAWMGRQRMLDKLGMQREGNQETDKERSQDRHKGSFLRDHQMYPGMSRKSVGV